MTTVGPWVVVLVLTVAIAAIIVVAIWMVRRHAASRRSLPPLFYPSRPANASDAPNVPVIAFPREILHRNGLTRANGASSANGVPRARGTASPKTGAPEAEIEIPRVAADRPTARTDHVVPPPAEEYREGETVRFERPSEQALQLLPGHLEVLAGTTREREIRFVRVPGETPHVVLGRDPGASPNAIRLGSSTVSRRHARMDYVDGHWLVKNLSHTNPLVVNDDLLVDSGPGRLLADGDRLELGEVVLRFHEH